MIQPRSLDLPTRGTNEQCLVEVLMDPLVVHSRSSDSAYPLEENHETRGWLLIRV